MDMSIFFLLLAGILYYTNCFERKKKKSKTKEFTEKLINSRILFITNEWDNDELDGYLVDIDNEMTFINQYKKYDIKEEIDIIIDSHGGKISSSDAIMNILLMHEGIINIYVPIKAYSAGSMLALCADNLYLNHYSLLSPTDPQFEENDNNVPVKHYLKLIKNKSVHCCNDDIIMKYYESQMLYNDNISNLKRILEKNYEGSVKNKIIKNFGYGDHPHEKQFNLDQLDELGLEYLTPIPKQIQDIFDLYNEIN